MQIQLFKVLSMLVSSKTSMCCQPLQIFLQLHTSGLSKAPPMAVQFQKTLFLTSNLRENIPRVLKRILLWVSNQILTHKFEHLSVGKVNIP